MLLKLKETPELVLDVEGVLPQTVQQKSREDVERMEVLYGNSTIDLGDFFDVYTEGDGLIFEGDLRKVKRIGWSLEDGEILVRGNAGMYVGAFMEGGKILVEGDIGPFSALNMGGGELIIKGDAGDYIGASYRGEWRGMSSGKILVEGNAGKEVGSHMRDGMIIIRGFADSFCGTRMSGGIVFASKANTRAGAGMRAGTIIINETPELLPGFHFEGHMKPDIDDEMLEEDYIVYSGDHAEKGAKGQLFCSSLLV
ncbi:MAG: formylmethanofuran dehydrogenase subunit C [Archaeoglobaceae archaeon]